jgi:hypothetical protein
MRSPQRKRISCADTKAASVQRALFHYRYETHVHVETEIHSRALINSAGSELRAVLSIEKKE